MPNVMANGIRIEYDTFGRPGDKPLLLVMGLGVQMTRWEPDFCEQLADRGHYVIRYDNRDVGLSEHFDHAGIPDIAELLERLQSGEAVEMPYTLSDMAADGIGLLDYLDIPKAHVCGLSMGGMIVQTMAIERPERLLSMTSIMSTTGNPKLPQAKPEAMEALTGRVATDRDGVIEEAVSLGRVLSGGGFYFDEEAARTRAGADFDRSFHPQGMVRQVAAIIGDGSRVERLRGVTVPALVVHGLADPLVPVDGGKDTAACIPGCNVVLIEGMGHEWPRPTWPKMIEAICALTERAS